ncbi:uncharacterized protein B0T23DRAFT_448745 [Neurospora hispaniola]|uniref:Uncharacterized protein n=1 Tax=Neurospora hispaniola TaxID=588809 RepID=A0AAJ0HZZ0_9PEZI|nr:hypothetical protein B0T23DRAFT_448745 [Neurospora hispaniola]
MGKPNRALNFPRIWTPIAPPQVTTAISSPFAVEPNAIEIQPIANAPIQKCTADIPAKGSTKRQKKREIFQEQLDAAIAKLDYAMKRIDILTAKANQHDALTHYRLLPLALQVAAAAHDPVEDCVASHIVDIDGTQAKLLELKAFETKLMPPFPDYIYDYISNLASSEDKNGDWKSLLSKLSAKYGVYDEIKFFDSSLENHFNEMIYNESENGSPEPEEDIAEADQVKVGI